MIDKEIKRKITSAEEITSAELIQYFNHMPAPIEKGLFKKIRQKRKEKTHDETKQYLLDNFDVVLGTISSHQLSEFFRGFHYFSHKKVLFKKMSENNLRIAELLNSSSDFDLTTMFGSILSSEYDAHVFFENNFKELYTNTNSQQFSVQEFFIIHPLSEGIKPLILQGLCDAASEQNIRKEDIPFFLYEYMRSATTNDRVFWNQIKTPDSPIPETTKEKIQETISPETALFLIQSTNQPLYVHKLFQSVGLDSPEIKAHLDTRLDDIVQEISSYSRDSSTVKMIIQELMEDEKVKPSDIEYSSKGGFGKVFKIGDKVLKYGRKAHNAELPYNSEIFLQPLVRQSLNGADFLEVYEQVDVGGGREDMYQLYKALRDQGLIWTDIKPNNIGRLRKENTIHFEGIDSVSHRAVGFREDVEIPVAQPGDFVLIDLDFVFLEGTAYDIPQEGTAMRNFHDFSARYKREKEAEQNQTPKVDKSQKTDFDEI